MEKEMIYSAMLCPDGHLLESLHRHMYVTHNYNGREYSLDGGTDYIRRSVNGDERMIILFSTDPIEMIRDRIKRWNRRIEKWVLLRDIDDDWLDAIIAYYTSEVFMPPKFLIQYIKEKQYRNVTKEMG